MASPMTLSEAFLAFLAQLPAEHRRQAQQEVNRFVIWCGRDRQPGSITEQEVARYVEQEQRRGGAVAERLEPLRQFFDYLVRNKLVPQGLSRPLRARRASPRTPKATETPPPVPEQRVLTPEGYAQLQRELEALRARRPQLAAQIAQARADGDISENAPLDALREEQGQLEARIRDLEAILAASTVARPEATEGIGLGSTIALIDLATGERFRFTLVDPAEADPRQGKISISSPLGRALQGRSVGDEVTVAAPAGQIRYRIEANGA